MTDITPTLLWIDIETTGLDSRDEVPLELGLALTDNYGNIFAETSWLIHDDTALYKERIGRAKEHDIVGPMHAKSGLWIDLDNRETRPRGYSSLLAADQDAAHWLKENGGEGLPLAGSSIGSLDRPFVIEHFPDLNSVIHYRNIDIGVLKELCRRLNPTLFAALTASWEDSGAKRETHRVTEDIWDSINEYLGYVDSFLFTEED